MKSTDWFLYDRNNGLEFVEYILALLTATHANNHIYVNNPIYLLKACTPQKQPPEVFCKKRCS